MRTNFDYVDGFFVVNRGLIGRLRSLKTRKERQRERLKYGASNWDAYSLSDYVLTVLYNGLEIIIRDRMGYPFGYTDEEWEACLIDLKDRIGSLLDKDENPDYYRHIRRATLSKSIYGEDSEEYKIAKAQCDWYISLYWENYKKFRKETFEILERVWDDLWD